MKAENKRTFRQLWAAIAETGRLPGMAIPDMPKVLTPEVKEKLAGSNLTADEIAMLLLRVIEIVEAGSVERVDTLVRRDLQDVGLSVDDGVSFAERMSAFL